MNERRRVINLIMKFWLRNSSGKNNERIGVSGSGWEPAPPTYFSYFNLSENTTQCPDHSGLTTYLINI